MIVKGCAIEPLKAIGGIRNPEHRDRKSRLKTSRHTDAPD